MFLSIFLVEVLLSPAFVYRATPARLVVAVAVLALSAELSLSPVVRAFLFVFQL